MGLVLVEGFKRGTANVKRLRRANSFATGMRKVILIVFPGLWMHNLIEGGTGWGW